MKFGAFSSKSLKAWRPCTIRIFSTEIWRALTSFSIKMERRSSETWMSLKLQKKAYSIRRPVLHIMLLQRCGVISLTTWRVTFGHSGALCMRASHWGLRSVPMIWQAYIEKSFVAFTHAYLIISVRNWPKCASLWSKCRPNCARHVSRSLRCPLSFAWEKNSSSMISTTMPMTHHCRMNFWAQSECLRTCSTWRTGCQSPLTIRIRSDSRIEALMTTLSAGRFRSPHLRTSRNKGCPLSLSRPKPVATSKGASKVAQPPKGVQEMKWLKAKLYPISRSSACNRKLQMVAVKFGSHNYKHQW